MVVELGVVVVDWLGVVVVDCDGVTPVADGIPCVAEGLVCVADGLPTVPAPPGAVAVVPDVPVVPVVPVVCAAATPIARMSTNDAHMDFFIRCGSFAASSAEFSGDSQKLLLNWDAVPVRLDGTGWPGWGLTRTMFDVSNLQVADDC